MVGKSGHKGISRIDSETNKTHGWYVRVQYLGTTHAKFFSDSAHGGEQKALQKAVKHRNSIERELGKPRTDRTVTAVSSRNTSGVQGVKRVAKAGGYAYEVTWSPAPGQVHRTTVSIKKYGEDEAFRRACRIRQQKEREFYGGLMLREIPPTPPLPVGQTAEMQQDGAEDDENSPKRGRPRKSDATQAEDSDSDDAEDETVEDAAPAPSGTVASSKGRAKSAAGKSVKDGESVRSRA
jgi:hypothetical protein